LNQIHPILRSFFKIFIILFPVRYKRLTYNRMASALSCIKEWYREKSKRKNATEWDRRNYWNSNLFCIYHVL